MACSMNHAMALREDGAVLCWGHDGWGELGVCHVLCHVPFPTIPGHHHKLHCNLNLAPKT